VVAPETRRRAAVEVQSFCGLSQRRACALLHLPRSTARYDKSEDSPRLIAQMRELAAERPRWGYRRLHLMLLREGWRINRKRVYWIYRDLGLQVRRKKRKQVARASRKPKQLPLRRNEAWSIDFMSDSLTDGRSFRLFNAVDDLTREAVVMEVGISLTAGRVIRALDHAIEERGKPARMTMDNGPEFTSRALDAWAYERGIELHFIRPGKPTENAFVESFNGSVRDECLCQHCFRDLGEACELVEDWMTDYNTVRPHSSIGNLTPSEYAASLREEGYPSSLTEQADACSSPELNNNR
jgi:putative transposase